MTITFSDGIGMVEVNVDEYGISCDGSAFYFTDTSGKDYKIPVHDVFGVVNR